MTRYSSDFGAFEISPIPGQPQIAHCHGFFVVPDARGKGVGTEQKRTQMQQLDSDFYDFATCTVDATNTAQKRVLKKTGWKHLATFDNRRTAGQTELWGWVVDDPTSVEASPDSWPEDETAIRGEIVEWNDAAKEKPDADITVMVMVGGEVEAWPGYWDGEHWRSADGMPSGNVIYWADMLEGPLS